MGVPIQRKAKSSVIKKIAHHIELGCKPNGKPQPLMITYGTVAVVLTIYISFSWRITLVINSTSDLKRFESISSSFTHLIPKRLRCNALAIFWDACGFTCAGVAYLQTLNYQSGLTKIVRPKQR